MEEVWKQVAELETQPVLEFDRGFDTALAQARVLCPEVDFLQFDPDNVVVDGKIVAQVVVGVQQLPTNSEGTNACSPLTLDTLDRMPMKTPLLVIVGKLFILKLRSIFLHHF